MLWENHRNPGIVLLLSFISHLGIAWSSHASWPIWFTLGVTGIYLAYALIDTFSLQRYIRKDVNSPYFIYLGANKHDFEDSLAKQKNTLNHLRNRRWKYHVRYNGLKDFDWQFYDSEFLKPLHWEDKIIEISNHYYRYSQRVSSGIADLHVFLRAPAPIALGVGHTIGRKQICNVYNYSVDHGTYICLPKSNIQNSQNPNSNHQAIQIVRTKKGRPVKKFSDKETSVSIILSFVPLPKERLPKLDGCVMTIYHKEKIKRIADHDFDIIANEISEVINMEIKLKERSIDLYAGLPSTLAFLLGIKIENKSPISVWNRNYQSENWERVCSLDRF